MPDKKQFFIETDILVDHLTHLGNEKSSLEKAMLQGICFTSVINASELYFAVQDKNEKALIDKLLRTLKVLGLNSRYSLSVNDFVGKAQNIRDALICVLVKNNKIPVLTNYHKKYKFTDVVLIDPKSL
jgi:hypothetical protein